MHDAGNDDDDGNGVYVAKIVFYETCLDFP